MNESGMAICVETIDSAFKTLTDIPEKLLWAE
jgi:hypothetical protein